MATARETLRLLCQSMMTHLANQKAISYAPRLRQVVQQEVFNLIGPFILTDEDLREKTLTKIGSKADVLEEMASTENDQYKAAQAVIRHSFGENELNGFYFQKPPKEVAQSIAHYLMKSSHIDEVYETDEDLVKAIISIVKKFKKEDCH